MDKDEFGIIKELLEKGHFTNKEKEELINILSKSPEENEEYSRFVERTILKMCRESSNGSMILGNPIEVEEKNTPKNERWVPLPSYTKWFLSKWAEVWKKYLVAKIILKGNERTLEFIEVMLSPDGTQALMLENETSKDKIKLLEEYNVKY